VLNASSRFLILLTTLVSGIGLNAQTSRGTVTGLVTDAQKAAVPKAYVSYCTLSRLRKGERWLFGSSAAPAL
jgi:hypothetical protein